MSYWTRVYCKCGFLLMNCVCKENMKTKEIKFPSELSFTTISKKNSPIEKFYKIIAKRIDKNVNIAENNLNVTKVRVNPADAKILKKVIKTWIKKNYDYLPARKVDIELGMAWLCYGPVEDKSIPKGKLIVELDELFMKRK
jgi:hypothetical protein